MSDLFLAFIWIIVGLGTIIVAIAVLAALAVFVGATEGKDYDEDFYPEQEEEFYHLKK
jgi:hypothetical protein